MLLPVLQTIFNRDLQKLQTEIDLYKNEALIWHFEKNISNSAGNLCLHLVGNLNTYIGGELGKTGYIRHRDLEFSLKDVPKTVLLEKIAATALVVETVLRNMNEEQITQEYPQPVLGQKMNVGFFLVHLATHLTYHLGQINYHRRFLDL
jgi:uncharacterized damage-inducible protein DinB